MTSMAFLYSHRQWGWDVSILCPDSDPVIISNGADGDDGESCTAAENGDGTYTILCPDSDPVIISNGADGQSIGVRQSVEDRGKL